MDPKDNRRQNQPTANSNRRPNQPANNQNGKTRSPPNQQREVEQVANNVKSMSVNAKPQTGSNVRNEDGQNKQPGSRPHFQKHTNYSNDKKPNQNKKMRTFRTLLDMDANYPDFKFKLLSYPVTNQMGKELAILPHTLLGKWRLEQGGKQIGTFYFAQRDMQCSFIAKLKNEVVQVGFGIYGNGAFHFTAFQFEADKQPVIEYMACSLPKQLKDDTLPRILTEINTEHEPRLWIEDHSLHDLNFDQIENIISLAKNQGPLSGYYKRPDLQWATIYYFSHITVRSEDYLVMLCHEKSSWVQVGLGKIFKLKNKNRLHLLRSTVHPEKDRDNFTNLDFDIVQQETAQFWHTEKEAYFTQADRPPQDNSNAKIDTSNEALETLHKSYITFWAACHEGDIDFVNAALNNMKEDERNVIVNEYDFKIGEYTPLILAARGGHLDIVKLLIKHGADVNKPRNKRTSIPYHYALAFGQYDVVNYFVTEMGAPVDGTALGFAKMCKNQRVTDLLNHILLSTGKFESADVKGSPLDELYKEWFAP